MRVIIIKDLLLRRDLYSKDRMISSYLYIKAKS